MEIIETDSNKTIFVNQKHCNKKINYAKNVNKYYVNKRVFCQRNEKMSLNIETKKMQQCMPRLEIRSKSIHLRMNCTGNVEQY